MERRTIRVLLLALSIALLALAGCDLFKAHTLALSMICRGAIYGDTVIARPSLDEGGLLVKFVLIGDTGHGYKINYGDSSAIDESADGVFYHTYTVAGTYLVTGYTRENQASGTVTMENGSPTVYGAFHYNGNQFEWLEKTVFDLRYLHHGCDNATGAAEYVTGVLDPDRDHYLLRFNVVGPNASGVPASYSVFLRDGTNVTNQWFDAKQVVVFMGYTKDDPPIPPPLTQWSDTELSTLDCDPIDPNPGIVTGDPVALFLEAKDDWGGLGSRLWAGYVNTDGSCE